MTQANSETVTNSPETQDTTIPFLPVKELSPEQWSTQTFIQEHQIPGIPVVLRQGVSEPEWNLEYLESKIGSEKFLCRFYGQERQTLDKRKWQTIGSGIAAQCLSFFEYAKLVRSGEAHREDIYLAKCPLATTPLANSPSLQAIGPQFNLYNGITDFNLWAGAGGHTESLHYDTFDGTLIQLAGQKRVVLFPPSQLSNLYPFPLIGHLHHGLKLRSWFSQVYPDKPDFEAFPGLEDAFKHRYEVILNPGDVLYLPVGWWHEVSALGEGFVCSANRFWAVFPRRRVLSQWSSWRTYFAFLLSMPFMSLKFIQALTKPNRKEELEKVLRMF
ncbi:MAG: cupin-like domain-containing protein [Phormidium sp. BM_Day4_Bin.17]|nr:cupin-like domain-containing protein [Phormidium sp. BM_Day4_Bin.17]UCJ12243.1 MAG: cupin-like domain-containing protein [Phormidium sp. PBR-2020]